MNQLGEHRLLSKTSHSVSILIVTLRSSLLKMFAAFRWTTVNSADGEFMFDIGQPRKQEREGG